MQEHATLRSLVIMTLCVLWAESYTNQIWAISFFVSLSWHMVHSAQMAGSAGQLLPADLDYAAIPTLSLEAREKLAKVRHLLAPALGVGGLRRAAACSAQSVCCFGASTPLVLAALCSRMQLTNKGWAICNQT